MRGIPFIVTSILMAAVVYYADQHHLLAEIAAWTTGTKLIFVTTILFVWTVRNELPL